MSILDAIFTPILPPFGSPLAPLGPPLGANFPLQGGEGHWPRGVISRSCCFSLPCWLQVAPPTPKKPPKTPPRSPQDLQNAPQDPRKWSPQPSKRSPATIQDAIQTIKLPLKKKSPQHGQAECAERLNKGRRQRRKPLNLKMK